MAFVGNNMNAIDGNEILYVSTLGIFLHSYIQSCLLDFNGLDIEMQEMQG